MLVTIGRLLTRKAYLWLFDGLTRSAVNGGGRKIGGARSGTSIHKGPAGFERERRNQELLFTAGPVVCEDCRLIRAFLRLALLEAKGAKDFRSSDIAGGQVRGFIGVATLTDTLSARGD
jgi:hypothetical protein